MIRGAPTLATLLLLLSAAAAAPVAAQAPTIRWSMANEYPATSIQGEADATSIPPPRSRARPTLASRAR